MSAFDLLSAPPQQNLNSLPRVELISYLKTNGTKWRGLNPSWEAPYWSFFVIHYDKAKTADAPRHEAWIGLPAQQRRVLPLHCLLCAADGLKKGDGIFHLNPTKPNTGSLSGHTSAKHRTLLLELDPSKKTKDESDHAAISASLVNGMLYQKNAKDRQALFEIRLTKAIVLGHRPFNLVEDEAMEAVFRTLDPSIQMPSRRKLTDTLIPKLRRHIEKSRVTPLLARAAVVHFAFDLWMKGNQDVFGLMISCMEEINAADGRPYWRFTDFAVALLRADATQGTHLANLVTAFLATQSMIDGAIAGKTASTTSDGGSNMKTLVEALAHKVGCTSLLPSLVRPISSDCQPHLINAVSRSVNSGKDFKGYELAKFEALGFAKPDVSIQKVIRYFLGGTTLLKKSSPTWREYVSCCAKFDLTPVVLRNPANTRWLSVVSYLILLVKFEQPYNDLWENAPIAEKHRAHAIPPRIWQFAKAILHELLPLYRLIHRLQRDSNRYLLSDAINDVAEIVRLYQRRLDEYIHQSGSPDMDSGVSSLRVHIVNNLVRSLKQHYDFFFSYSKDKEHYMFALLLDPRYCGLGVLGRTMLYQYTVGEAVNPPLEARQAAQDLHRQYLNRLWEVALELKPPPTELEVRSGVKRKQASWTTGLDEDVDRWEGPVLDSKQQDLLNIKRQHQALKAYEGPLTFPLDFWPSHKEMAPDLYRLAQIFVGINKSQVKVEGLFSVTGYVSMDRRSRTGVDRLDDICYIWQNSPPSQKKAAADSKRRNEASIFGPEEEEDWDPSSKLAQLEEEQAEFENEQLAGFETDLGSGYAYLPGGDHLDPIFDLTDLPPPVLPDLEAAELAEVGDPAFVDTEKVFETTESDNNLDSLWPNL